MSASNICALSPDVMIGDLTKRIYQMTIIGLEPAFSDAGMSYLQGSALIAIGFGGGTTCRDLAREITHDRGATTRLLDRLEMRGFLLRERSATDRRVVRIVLTDKGRTTARTCLEQVTKRWSQWLSAWDPADIARLIADLRRLQATLRSAVA